MLNAPVGFRFNPAEEELVGYYLANRVAGNMQDLWPGLINEFDMYTEEPWDLWQRFHRPNLLGNNMVEAKSDNYIYLFTTLKKVASGGNGKKVNRRVGKTGGTWHGQNTKFVQRDDGLSWCERHFSYKNDKCKEQNGVWLMTEFCFHEDDVLVLCRIGKKPLRGRDDGEDHRLHASVSAKGRSPGTRTTSHASSAVVYDVNDDNFTVQGTKAKRTRMEGMFSGIGISIVDGELVQHNGGLGCGFGNQGSANVGIPPYHHGIDHGQGGNSLLNPMRIDEAGAGAGAVNMRTPYHHGIDHNQGGDGTVFNQIRIDEYGVMNIGIPYHHGPRFVASNHESRDVNHEEDEDGSTKMQEEVGEDHVDDHNWNSVDLDDLDIVVEDMDELEEAMRTTYPEYYDTANGSPIRRMQEDDMGTNGLDDILRRMQEEDMEGKNSGLDIDLSDSMNMDQLKENTKEEFR